MKGFSDLKPISLCFFTKKLISRVIHGRIVVILPKIISRNQSSFVKGSNIAENILLAQEIIKDINTRNKNVNVIVKLDENL